MALKFYNDAGLTQEITTLTTQHENTGAVVEKKVYLGNTVVQYRYENIVISSEDTSIPDETDWIQLAQDVGGSAGTYEPGGDPLVFANISNFVGHPFWVKITTPPIVNPINKTDLQLRVDYREFAI